MCVQRIARYISIGAKQILYRALKHALCVQYTFSVLLAVFEIMK
jgi:hypothetical protein